MQDADTAGGCTTEVLGLHHMIARHDPNMSRADLGNIIYDPRH